MSSEQVFYAGGYGWGRVVPPTVEAENRALGNAEAVRVHYEGLEGCACYVHGSNDNRVTLWPGNVVGTVVRRGQWHRHNSAVHFPVKWRQVTVRDLQGRMYTGREYDSQQLIRLRRMRGKS